jgi:hypothetical protein
MPSRRGGASGRTLFSPRLVAVVTAVSLMAGATPGRADYTLEQLQEIERLIAGKNCAGLWSFVRSNPSITAGDDPLAVELRNFIADTERGKLTCFESRANENSRTGTLIAPSLPTPPAAIY